MADEFIIWERLAGALRSVINEHHSAKNLNIYMERAFGETVKVRRLLDMTAPIRTNVLRLTPIEIHILDRLFRESCLSKGFVEIVNANPFDSLAVANPEVVFVLPAKHTPLEQGVERWLRRTTYLSISDVRAYSEVRVALDRIRRDELSVKLETTMMPKGDHVPTKWESIQPGPSVVCIGSPISNPACTDIFNSMFSCLKGKRPPVRFGWDNERPFAGPFSMSPAERERSTYKSPWRTLGVTVEDETFWVGEEHGQDAKGNLRVVHTEYGVIAAQRVIFRGDSGQNAATRADDTIRVVLAGTIGPATLGAAHVFTQQLTLDIPEVDSNLSYNRVLLAVVEVKIIEDDSTGDNRTIVEPSRIVKETIWTG